MERPDLSTVHESVLLCNFIYWVAKQSLLMGEVNKVNSELDKLYSEVIRRQTFGLFTKDKNDN